MINVLLRVTFSNIKSSGYPYFKPYKVGCDETMINPPEQVKQKMQIKQ